MSLLTAAAACELLGISRRELWWLRVTGRVPYLRTPAGVRYPMYALIASRREG